MAEDFLGQTYLYNEEFLLFLFFLQCITVFLQLFYINLVYSQVGNMAWMRYNKHMNMKNKSKTNQQHTEPGMGQDRAARKGLWKKVIGGAVFCVLVLAGIAVAGYTAPNMFLPSKHGYVHVRSDMTAVDVAEEMHDGGYIASPLWFRAAAQMTGQAGQLKEGEYSIDSSMSLQQILAKLTSGESEAERLVIPEGYTVWQTAKRVAAMGHISEDDFLAAAKDASLLYPYMKGNRDDVTFPTEGFLFPDTYFVPNDATAEDVVRMMLKNFDAHLSEDMKKQIADKNMSIYQFVTLASLVEKEAKYEEDRPLIASVFLNRLAQHMKLQSDASISYAMGSHKAAYSIAETQYDSPYNTYMYEGLPPGPIANPGMACMNAILQAPQTSYLYFVADKDGHNYFSVTYDDHMKNVQEHMP